MQIGRSGARASIEDEGQRTLGFSRGIQIFFDVGREKHFGRGLFILAQDHPIGVNEIRKTLPSALELKFLMHALGRFVGGSFGDRGNRGGA